MKSIIGAATAAALATVGLSGCGTITQGISQRIAITSSPPGGRCDLIRNGEHIDTIYATPGIVAVDKTKHDIMMTCTKRGYETQSVNLESGYGIGTFGNAIIGGAIGWGIDSSLGADNKYPSRADVKFVPLNGSAAAATLFAGRLLCTQEEQELARRSAENYATIRLICD
jgi:hypothetical protein